VTPIEYVQQKLDEHSYQKFLDKLNGNDYFVQQILRGIHACWKTGQPDMIDWEYVKINL
jgi:hypothetical protein